MSTRVAVRTPRIVQVALILAFGVTGLAVALPGVARAGSCNLGDFCLWNGEWSGGLYQWHGNDGNLGNDYFENADTHLIVDNRASSAWNHGYPAYYDDVRVYDYHWYRGASGCIPRSTKVRFANGWFVSDDWRLSDNPGNNDVGSFKWVRSC